MLKEMNMKTFTTTKPEEGLGLLVHMAREQLSKRKETKKKFKRIEEKENSKYELQESTKTNPR